MDFVRIFLTILYVRPRPLYPGDRRRQRKKTNASILLETNVLRDGNISHDDGLRVPLDPL